ncbi:MAG TPA: hypothetical protein VFV68_06065, partial [Agriterribacter sp.]|nr:hypothetical protein [Agriterribacter sp.]
MVLGIRCEVKGIGCEVKGIGKGLGTSSVEIPVIGRTFKKSKQQLKTGLFNIMSSIILSALWGVLMMFSGIFFKKKSAAK